METRFVEATNGPQNWGKFMLARFTPEEWAYRSAVGGHPLLVGRGWGPNHLLVFDVETGEGALFRPGGLASYDLDKHRVWVCPLFEPFLEYLYGVDLSDLSALPAVVDLPDAPFLLAGHRRPGPPDLRWWIEKLEQTLDPGHHSADWRDGVRLVLTDMERCAATTPEAVEG